jgi:hypothetical protein
MTLSLVFGTAFEVHTTDEILDHPNVRAYATFLLDACQTWMDAR